MRIGKTYFFKNYGKTLERSKTIIRINLKSRKPLDTIKSEYEKSLSRLLPFREKLYKTDWFIDQIVYELYRLTQDEIKLVEDVG